MADAADFLCWECVSDELLRSWIRENGYARKCAFCGKRRVATALSGNETGRTALCRCQEKESNPEKPSDEKGELIELGKSDTLRAAVTHAAVALHFLVPHSEEQETAREVSQWK
jgi:hypothetical protein